MNVTENVGNPVVDVIRNVNINAVWISVIRNAGIFVPIALMIAILNASTQNVIKNALKSVPEYHAMSRA